MRRAGQLATSAGLSLVLLYYAWVDIMGNWEAEEAAYIWKGRLFSWDIELNQDYGILYILPLVIAFFLAAQLLPGGRGR